MDYTQKHEVRFNPSVTVLIISVNINRNIFLVYELVLVFARMNRILALFLWRDNYFSIKF